MKAPVEDAILAVKSSDLLCSTFFLQECSAQILPRIRHLELSFGIISAIPRDEDSDAILNRTMKLNTVLEVLVGG